MFDTHAHLDHERFADDRVAVMARARTAGVTRVLVPGLQPSHWGALRLLSLGVGWDFAIGTHPQCLPEALAVAGNIYDVTPDFDDLDGACAVGECGLDGAVHVPMDVQVAVLEQHLGLAREAKLPVILHCWHAHDRMLATLQRWAPLTGVMHSYSGGADLVQKYIAMGLHISFAGAVTRPNARRPVASLLAVPLDRLLAETDAPDQSPDPHRGRCEPAFLVDILAAMARIRGEDVTAAVTANAVGLFGPR